jgi:AbrB family looped-hinge helix DNA binding protein
MKLTATITAKGQVVIPALLRKKLHLQKGSTLTVTEENGKIVLEPSGVDPVAAGRGMLSTRGRVLRQLMEDRKLESAR